ncbi:extracellular solute-binding protein [Paenibacillus hemerocallicola]|uniref:Extracellular solute-binding protein n=1 Tax=Paenibacillus hemerocallicola TaxID=1172614 RepID=A0A5C4SWR8_9BACL|nr:extracellular solute-binding protein [Paenibacillus hemerocallicola]TNJ59882.1 extracellular solute-binding protein [Paenibacillus hemerocallicola]
MKRWYKVGILVSICFVTACGGKGGESGASPTPEPKKDPFTMTIYAAGVKPEEFDSRFRETLERKFPHIKFEYKTNTAGNALKDLVATNSIPDLIRTDIPGLLSGYLDYQIGEDLNPYVKAHSYDLKRFNKVFIDEILEAAQSDALYGLPVPPYFPQVLYYNKGLFDRFGVAYPTDGMTWDDVYELAKRMTRVDGSQVYRGFSSATGTVLRDNTLSMSVLDPAKDGLADQTKWKTLFDNLLRLYQIPNNKIESTSALESAIFGKGFSAMNAASHNIYSVIPPEVDWDIVSAPVHAGGPKLMGQRGPAYWSIANTSKHKEEAFEVIMAMLADEVQLQDSRSGIPTVLNNKSIQNELGKGHPVYGTKNMKAVSFYEPSMYPTKRQKGLTPVADGTQTNLLNDAFRSTAEGKVDVNTALRQLDEKLKQELEKERAK